MANSHVIAVVGGKGGVGKSTFAVNYAIASAIDAKGNMYIVEDQPGGIDDIWFARDENDDGVAEAVGKWASLSTAGAESTGLYFDKFKPNVAYVNVQHPDSGVDRTIMITAPCPKMKHHDRDHHDGRDKD